MDEDDGWDDTTRKMFVEAGAQPGEYGTGFFQIKLGFWICLGIVALIVIASMLGID